MIFNNFINFSADIDFTTRTGDAKSIIMKA